MNASSHLDPAAFAVRALSPRAIVSPLHLASPIGASFGGYVPDTARVALDIESSDGSAIPTVLIEKAGPREMLHFDPRSTRVAIVACGGMCPGLNNVVRSIVLEVVHAYGIIDVLGFQYGFEGLNPAVGLPPIALDPEIVRMIHHHGGCVLGLSRGQQPLDTMVQTLIDRRIDILFAIGGDGTLRGAHAIAKEIEKRGLDIAVVGVPKTIDNDVEYVDKTFGFETAVEVARSAIDAAHVEAWGARNGIAIVKLMGRDSGFIACAATRASSNVNFCLIPEVPFRLEGPGGLFAALEKRIEQRRHAVIVVAEGCAAAAIDEHTERDASGNVRYSSLDVGPELRDKIALHFKSRQIATTVRYIDPSYLIRSVPANATDATFCDALARHAVHAGMAGKTDLVIGRVHGVFAHIPIEAATRGKKRVDPEGELWRAVTETTGQPRL